MADQIEELLGEMNQKADDASFVAGILASHPGIENIWREGRHVYAAEGQQTETARLMASIEENLQKACADPRPSETVRECIARNWQWLLKLIGWRADW